MKTKFIRVSVQERLPEQNKHVTIFDDDDHPYQGFLTDNNIWMTYTPFDHGEITHWMEEVSDLEEEMREMLDKVLMHDPCHYNDYWHSLTSEIKQLLNELKQIT